MRRCGYLPLSPSSASSVVVVLIAARWWGAAAAALAGVAFLVNPVILGIAVLARSYMLSVLAVALAVLALDVAVRTVTRTGVRAWAPWLAYGLASVVAVLLQPFAALSIGATIVLAIGRRREIPRWSLATLPAALATVALLARARDQSAQVSWIGEVTPRSVVEGVALASGIAVDRGLRYDLLGLGLVAAMTIMAFLISSTEHRRALGAASALAFGPPAVLYAVSVLLTPVLTARYLSWVAIGVALLLGGAAHATRHRAAAVVTGAPAALLIVPIAITAQRSLTPPPRPDNFPETVAQIQAAARPGDALIVVQQYEAGGVAFRNGHGRRGRVLPP